MKKFTFIGWYGRRNCGDDALQLAIQTLFSDYDLTFQCSSPTTENLVLGGGDVVCDLYLKLLGDKKFNVLGAGLGYPGQVEFLKGKAREVFLRNQADVDLARQAGLDAYYTPDLAFALDVPICDPILPQGKKKLGIMVADTMNASVDGKHQKLLNYVEFLKWEVAECLRYLSEWYDLIFIPMSDFQYARDIRMIYDIESRLPGITAKIFPAPLDPLSTIKLISELDLLVTMRFHGIIFATLAGTPFVNLGVSRKTQLFCQENGLSDLSILPYALEYERFTEVVKCAETQGVRERLIKITAQKKHLLEQVIGYVKETW